MKSEMIKEEKSFPLSPKLIEVSNYILLINEACNNEYGTIVYTNDPNYNLGDRIYFVNEKYSEFHGEIKLSN